LGLEPGLEEAYTVREIDVLGGEKLRRVKGLLANIDRCEGVHR